MKRTLPFTIAPLLVCACAPSAPPPTDASAVTATVPAATPATASPALDPSCEQACSRIETCSKRPATDCRADCAENLAPTGKAALYLACVQALSCEAITASLQMNSGPLGYCRTRGR